MKVQIPYLPCLMSSVCVRKVGFEGMHHAKLMRKCSEPGPELTLPPAQFMPVLFPWITEVSPL